MSTERNKIFNFRRRLLLWLLFQYDILVAPPHSSVLCILLSLPYSQNRDRGVTSSYFCDSCWRERLFWEHKSYLRLLKLVKRIEISCWFLCKLPAPAEICVCYCQIWHQCQLFGFLALHQNWPPATHKRATYLTRAHTRAAAVSIYTEKNHWFTVCCIKNDEF